MAQTINCTKFVHLKGNRRRNYGIKNASTCISGDRVMGRLVLAGVGHAHMALLEAVLKLTAKGHAVTAVERGKRLYYSGMGPGMLGGMYLPGEISFPVREMVEKWGGTFIQDKVTAINATSRTVITESGREIPYDVLSCNLGSFVSGKIANKTADSVFTVKPVENLISARKCILDNAGKREVRIGVCGGGPAAFEVAGNAWAAAREKNGKGSVIQIFTGSEPLRNMPKRVLRLARRTFERRNIDIISGSHVAGVESDEIHLENGRKYPQDIVMIATGVRPSKVFADSGFQVGADGGLPVNQYLQSTAYSDIFGGGDCIHFEPSPLDKVGVYAVRQNPVLLHNVRARLEGKPLKPFDPGGAYLLILNLGGCFGILHKHGIVFGGHAAFRIKDHIDRRFIREFQPERDL